MVVKVEDLLFLLLLCDSHDAATTPGGLCVLSTDSDAPVVAETAMCTYLLESLEVLTELVVELVGNNL